MKNPSRLEVYKMFDQIAGTYDRLNRLLSFGQDQKWRRELSKHLTTEKPLRLLDIATGTGDQIFALLEAKIQLEKAVGIDPSSEMLQIAQKKLEKWSTPHIQFQQASAEKLPFSANSFDAVSLSFGIRNTSSVETALSEIHRVLKRKGKCLILEFSLPPQPIRSFYLLYLRHILPKIGGWLSKHESAYRYLNQTIETFPHGKQFGALLKGAGFSEIKLFPMALGAVTLYVGVKF
ncbi:MAG: bifunctional demethylmenaquinone methyltransferase/2-methoxy-6-polyprenyl-1,4-benzoquinol methylase UbiE [Chlamydiia bacterium]|nr:bifunctional demethylmenaquinone methyltransferase/2-methoxy-6-polyprenyl-1,4-benzoquinol methylase UbiE [Chlamydiia bacterium]